MKFIFVFAIAFNVLLLNANSAKIQRRQVPSDEANAIQFLIVGSLEGVVNAGIQLEQQLSTTLTENSAVVEAISDTISAQTELLATLTAVVPNGQLPALTIPDLDTVPTSVANAILVPVVSYWLTVLNGLYDGVLGFNLIELPQSITDDINDALDNQIALIGLLQDLNSPANVQKRQLSPSDTVAVEALVELSVLLLVNGVQQIFLQLASLIPTDSSQAQIFADTALSYEQIKTSITDSVPTVAPIPSLPSLTISGLSSLDSSQVHTILSPIVLFLSTLLSSTLNGVLSFNLIALPQIIIDAINQLLNNLDQITGQI